MFLIRLDAVQMAFCNNKEYVKSCVEDFRTKDTLSKNKEQRMIKDMHGKKHITVSSAAVE